MSAYNKVAKKIKKGEELSDSEKKLQKRRELLNKVNPKAFKLAKKKEKKENNSLKIKDD